MLFGMFFGAGNLIFPVSMGQQAGSQVWITTLGFLITGVGLPLLGVAALGISQSNGLFDLSSKAGRQTGGHRRHPHTRQGQDPRYAPAQQAGCAPFGCLWFHWHHSRMPSAYAPVDRFRTRPVPKIPKTILPQEVPL